jgi:hypothetical protein
MPSITAFATLSASGFCVCGSDRYCHRLAFVHEFGISNVAQIVSITAPVNRGLFATAFATLARKSDPAPFGV